MAGPSVARTRPKARITCGSTGWPGEFHRSIGPPGNRTMSAALPEKAAEKFIRIGNLPTLPHAATRALAIVKDPDCSVQDFTRIIGTDPALAASLLKLVNSSYYAAATRVSNLTTAVVRLGLRETQNLILAVSVRSVFRWVPAGQEESRDRLWKHSDRTAILCRSLNSELGLGFQGEELSAGLAHDLGRILVAVAFPEAFHQIIRSAPLGEADLLERERERLGFDHTQAGAWLSAHWNLPPELTEAIQYHHTPALATQAASLVATVALGDDLANHLEVAQALDGFDLAGSAGWEALCSCHRRLEEIDQERLSKALLGASRADLDAIGS